MTIYCCTSVKSLTNKVHVLHECCMFSIACGIFKGWYRNIFTVIIQILTWNPWSTDVLEIVLIAFEIRGTLPCKTSSHPHPILLHHAHHEGQHEQGACCWTSHFQSWWLVLHVWQWKIQCILKHSSCIDNNNTALSTITAIIIRTALPPLGDNKRAMS